MVDDSRKDRDKHRERDRYRSRSPTRRRDSRSPSYQRRYRRDSRDSRRERSRSRGHSYRHRERRSRSRSRSLNYADSREDKRRRSQSPSKTHEKESESEKKIELKTMKSVKEDVGIEKSKKITVNDIMKANPGMTFPEAVIRLNEYNTAVLNGLPPPSLTGSTVLLGFGSAISLLNGALERENLSMKSLLEAAPISSDPLTKPFRDVYIGNLPAQSTIGQISEFMNGCMRLLGFSTPGGSVLSIWISTDMHYAFCEMRMVEEANAAIAYLSGVYVGTTQLKIGRPKGYTGVGLPTSSCGPAKGPLSSTLFIGGTSNGTESMIASNCVLLTNLPSDIADNQVSELLSPFGELKTFTCFKVSDTKKSVIFEYKDATQTDLGIMGLSNIEILGSKLSAHRIAEEDANVLLKVHCGSLDSHAVTTQEQTLNHYDNSDEVTRFIRFSNMTTTEDLNDNELYDDLKDDVKSECEKYGKVQSIVVPRYPEDIGYSYIYVEFGNSEGALKAKHAIQGRRFNGNTVVATFASEIDYKQLLNK